MHDERVNMGEQIVDGQGIEQRDVAGGGVVADAVGVLPNMHVAGAVQLILNAPMPQWPRMPAASSATGRARRLVM